MEESEVRTIKKGEAEILKILNVAKIVCRKYFEIHVFKKNFKARFLTSIHIFWAVFFFFWAVK
jgi:hypothetical protein